MDYKSFFTTSCLGFGDLEFNREVRGDGEGVLLLEWLFDLNFLSFHNRVPPSSAKMLKPRNLLRQHGG